MEITFDERSFYWQENENFEITIGTDITEKSYNEVFVHSVLMYFTSLQGTTSGFQCFTLADIIEKLGMPIPNFNAHDIAWFCDNIFTCDYHVEDSLVKDGKQRYIINVYGASLISERMKEGGVAPCATKNT